MTSPLQCTSKSDAQSRPPQPRDQSLHSTNKRKCFQYAVRSAMSWCQGRVSWAWQLGGLPANWTFASEQTSDTGRVLERRGIDGGSDLSDQHVPWQTNIIMLMEAAARSECAVRAACCALRGALPPLFFLLHRISVPTCVMCHT